MAHEPISRFRAPRRRGRGVARCVLDHAPVAGQGDVPARTAARAGARAGEPAFRPDRNRDGRRALDVGAERLHHEARRGEHRIEPVVLLARNECCLHHHFPKAAFCDPAAACGDYSTILGQMT